MKLTNKIDIVEQEKDKIRNWKGIDKKLMESSTIVVDRIYNESPGILRIRIDNFKKFVTNTLSKLQDSYKNVFVREEHLSLIQSDLLKLKTDPDLLYKWFLIYQKIVLVFSPVKRNSSNFIHMFWVEYLYHREMKSDKDRLLLSEITQLINDFKKKRKRDFRSHKDLAHVLKEEEIEHEKQRRKKLKPKNPKNPKKFKLPSGTYEQIIYRAIESCTVAGKVPDAGKVEDALNRY